MLPVERVRTLELVREAGATEDRYVAAASGLAIVTETLYVVADEELYLAVFPKMGREKGDVIRLLGGRLPTDEDRRQNVKPDLESLTPLEPSERFPHGGVLALGSGSSEDRDRGAFAAFDGAGAIAEVVTIDCGPLFASLREHIPGLNLEGTAVVGERFRILQRGDKEEATPAHIDLSLQGIVERISRERHLDGDLVIDVETHNLGRIRGVDLCFSDADTLADGTVVFSASAERDDDGVDGAPVGSAVGVMSVDGEILRLEPIEVEVKVEGLAARDADGDIEAFMVTDQDDPGVPTDLWRVLIPSWSGAQ